MPSKTPRIIVADEGQGLVSITRSALDLMSRKPRLIETRTGEDCLDEIRLREPDLLIAAYKLGSPMTGVMLALQAKVEAAALPIVVVATEVDPELDEETLAESPFQYLRRPIVPELFIRALRIALDGPEAVPASESPADVFGPVPEIDVENLRPIIFHLMSEVNAMSVILADRNGKVLSYDGAAGYIDRELLAAGLGPTFANTSRILPIVGEKPRVLKYYDGDRYDVFSLAIGLHHFVSLVFDSASGDRAIGAVRRYGGSAVDKMLELIGDAAFQTHPPVAVVPEPAPVPAKGKGRRRTQEMTAVKIATGSHKRIEPVTTPAPQQPRLSPIKNFDPKILDALGSLDLSKADELFDPDRLESLVGPEGLGFGEEQLSINDAQAQGIIDPLD